MAAFKKIFYLICLSLLIMQSSELYVFIDATNVLSGRSYRVCAQHEPDSSKLASSKSEAIPYKLAFWNTDDDYWCQPLSRNASFANCVVYGLHESKNSSECGPHSASIVSRLRYLHEHDGDVALFLEDDLSFSYFDPTIPFGFLNMSIYFIDNYWFQKILDLSENPRNSSNIHLRFYSPVNWTVAITPVVLVVIALFALMAGSYWAGYKHDIALKMKLRLAEAYRKISDGNGASASDSTRANNFENSPNSKASNIQSNLRTLFCALFMSVGLLLFLFFAYDYAIWFILSIYVFSAYVSLYDCFSHVIPNCLFCHKEIPLNCLKAIFSCFTKRSDSRNWSVPFKRIFLCCFCLTLTISWYVVVLQNILGLAILISVVSNVRLPTLKAVTVFSLAFLIYDVTMVFISPYFTNGCSIMLDVVTGGGCSKGRGAVVNVENAKEMLPLMIVVPQLTDLAVSCAKLSGIYSLMPTSLGFGDVIIPGIMVGFNAAFDRSWNIRYNLYFIMSSIGYLLGLVVTLTILLITGSGQPALLYIVPSVLFFTYALALCRGEVLKMWRESNLKTSVKMAALTPLLSDEMKQLHTIHLLQIPMSEVRSSDLADQEPGVGSTISTVEPTPPPPSQKSTRRLWRRLAFGFGHVYNDLCASMWFSFLLVFLRKALLFTAPAAGSIFLIGQVADAISTPAVGFESDRLNVPLFCLKYGRRKFLHLIGTICVAVSFVFLFMKCFGCTYGDDGTKEWIQLLYYCPFVVIFQFGWASNVALTITGAGILFSVLFHVGVKEKCTLYRTQYRKIDEALPSEVVEPTTVVGSTTKKVLVTWKHWLQNRQFYLISILYMCIRLCNNISMTYLPLYILETQNMNKMNIATVPLAVYLSSFFTATLFSFRMVTRVINRKIGSLIGIVVGIGASGWMWCEKLQMQIYGVAILMGISSSSLIINALAFTSDLINKSTESGAFVFGAMSLFDKLLTGVAVQIIQALEPLCHEATCGLINLYFKYVMVVVPAASLLVASVILFLLWPQKIGYFAEGDEQQQEDEIEDDYLERF
ncbi:Major facilitator superfamily domain-containing protein 12 [Trichinella zimbabwensis]|uniref:Major facilitator superfamily domain-containing protein 12 n=1 Tax=Trichinella zimbabwensis TaxID=268475 RepID=A0A0V1H4J4_9BILA|nr:Major facilitator superfamily domain-containing protein 12 [Trichinella zimbabwensis]